MKKVSNWIWGTSSSSKNVQQHHPFEPPPTLDSQIHALSVKRSQALREASKHGKEGKLLLKSGNRAGASKALQRKKHWETQARLLEGQISNLEQTQMSIESTAAAHDMVSVMKQSATQMSGHMNGLSVEDVEDVHLELNDLTLQSGELSSALSRQFTSPYNVEDDDDIANQLKEWEDENNQEESNVVENLFPQTPTHKLSNNNNNNNNNSDTKKYIVNEK